MTITQLEYISAVQKYGSFSLAAKAKGVSQPTLSEMIRKLEDELDVVIFDRKKNPVRPTSAGLLLLSQAHSVLQESARLTEIASDLKNEVKGELRIGLIPTLAPSLVRLFLKSFKAKYPEVSITIFEEGTDALVVKVAEGELDVAILATPESAPDNLVVKPLFFEQFVLYAAAENGLLKKKRIVASDLDEQKIVLMDETHCVREQIESLCQLGKRKTLSQTTVHGGISTLISVVDEEQAFTLIPELLQDHVNRGQVREFEEAKHHRKVSMILNKTYLKRKIVDLLAEEIIQNLPDKIETTKSRSMKIHNPAKSRF